MTATTDAQLYRMAAAVRVRPLDTSYQQPRFQIETASARRYEVNEAFQNFLMYAQEPRTCDELVAEAKRRNLCFGTKPVTGDFVHNQLVATGMLTPVGAEGCDSYPISANVVGQPPSTTHSSSEGYKFLTLHRDIISAESIKPITRCLKPLFTLVGASTAGVLSCVATIIYALQHHSTETLASASTSDWVVLIVLVYGSILWHELGHASASEALGVRHGPIGVGLYVIYPVAYCNVTSAWYLSRAKRVVIDLAGMYFQALFAGVLCVCWLKTHYHVLPLAIASIWATILLNLNPFLKFDGYWILTDSLGIPSLHRACSGLLRQLISLICGTSARSDEVLRGMPRLIQLSLVSYALIYNTFLCYLLFLIARHLLPVFCQTVIRDALLLLRGSLWKRNGFDALLEVGHLLFLSLAAYGGIRFIIQMALVVVKEYRYHAQG